MGSSQTCQPSTQPRPVLPSLKGGKKVHRVPPPPHDSRRTVTATKWCLPSGVPNHKQVASRDPSEDEQAAVSCQRAHTPHPFFSSAMMQRPPCMCVWGGVIRKGPTMSGLDTSLQWLMLQRCCVPAVHPHLDE